MPHVVIKAISGASSEQMKEAAEQIKDVIVKTLGKPEKYTSVSMSELFAARKAALRASAFIFAVH